MTDECTSVCPAGVWQTADDDVSTIAYENCPECGNCRFACPDDNVKWSYPATGNGVVYKHYTLIPVTETRAGP